MSQLSPEKLALFKLFRKSILPLRAVRADNPSTLHVSKEFRYLRAVHSDLPFQASVFY